jgi:hypothetical protein
MNYTKLKFAIKSNAILIISAIILIFIQYNQFYEKFKLTKFRLLYSIEIIVIEISFFSICFTLLELIKATIEKHKFQKSLPAKKRSFHQATNDALKEDIKIQIDFMEDHLMTVNYEYYKKKMLTIFMFLCIPFILSFSFVLIFNNSIFYFFNHAQIIKLLLNFGIYGGLMIIVSSAIFIFM